MKRLANAWFVLALSAPLLCPALVFAQKQWPSKPLRILVPFPAGGATDVFARLVAPHLSERIGQPVIVENRLGANGTIGTESVARAPADGYTLLMGTIATHSIQQTLLANLAYDPVKDFIPIVQVASQAYVVVVHPAFAANSLGERAALAAAAGCAHCCRTGLPRLRRGRLERSVRSCKNAASRRRTAQSRGQCGTRAARIARPRRLPGRVRSRRHAGAVRGIHAPRGGEMGQADP